MKAFQLLRDKIAHWAADLALPETERRFKVNEEMKDVLDWLDKQIAKPQAPLSELAAGARRVCADPKNFRRHGPGMIGMITSLADALENAESRAQRYRECLEWYADKENYMAAHVLSTTSHVDIDQGIRARAALEGT